MTTYRNSLKFIEAAYYAACQNARTSQGAKRAMLANVGRNPLSLKARKHAACECHS